MLSEHVSKSYLHHFWGIIFAIITHRPGHHNATILSINFQRPVQASHRTFGLDLILQYKYPY